MTELIITEKPSSAQKVASALADNKLTQKKIKQCSYYEITHNKKTIIVTSAVGHLYGLAEKKKKDWSYPVFDIEWEESYKQSKELSYVKDYIDAITQLAKKSDEFTIACDYDVEGEVIGLNVIRFTCKKKDANRMKFSTLTKPDLVAAYEHKMHHLDWGQANAGETRHKLDWYYGINLSRALTASVKAAGSFKVMSAGRVQGPALKMLVEREKEISAFRPEPFWQLQLLGNYHQHSIEGWHEKDKFFDAREVKKVLDKIRHEKEALIKKVSKNRREQSPPHPFDLTSLQTESYNLLHITPKETLDIAQRLYLAGVTSYPRTSSQQLDPKLGFREILSKLSKQPHYELLAKKLLGQKELKPNNGSKTDPAHPAIYPTGQVPKVLKFREQKVYDLIVKRFLATFAAPAIRETMEVLLDVKNEIFIVKGTRTITENWHAFYKPYVKVDDIILPEMKEREIVKIKEIKKIDKETQPPNRYNQSSIIKELEKRNLGTKATRAEILDRLFQRGYIEGIQIHVTKFGMETIKILSKYAPTIIDEKLTADFEEDMEKIREGGEKQEKVLDRAKKFLIVLLEDFRKKEKAIGKEIIESLRETQAIQNYVGPCPKCKEGKLNIRYGKFGKFIACDRYPQCSATFKLPPAGMIKNSEKVCAACGYPRVQIINKGKRPREVCINPSCKSKISAEGKQEIKDIQHHRIEKKCPLCKKDLVVRRSIYGEFLGCSGYPSCKYTERLNGAQDKKKEEIKKVEEKKGKK
ncbi:MAG: DNA topoisomerase I [Nanoarchaeota archaeon]